MTPGKNQGGSAAVADGLEKYRGKRNFARSPEPRGEEKRAAGASFVVQKHAARQLHYDFRLELKGVLKSWAVPKGPSLDPSEKRLAVHVEDHPAEYRDFEGIIPKEEYGGGTVMIWDAGTWTSLDSNPLESYRAGVMKFRLDGRKLCGRWTLIRMKPKPDESDSRENWLLIKERDEHARPLNDYDVTRELPNSAVSGRSLDQIAADRLEVWHSSEHLFDVADLERIPGAQPASLPAFIEPQLATLAESVPQTGNWIHEIKLDGYRELCRVEDREIRFVSRNGKDWTERFPSLVREMKQLRVGNALFDGEVVVLRTDGKTSFQELQDLGAETSQSRLAYYVFDLLHLEGFDLRGVTLRKRKQLVHELLASLASDSRIRFCDHFDGDGDSFYRAACEHGLEGVICKRADRPYRSGRGRDWLKVKCLKRQEFVVVGFTAPSGKRKGLGALLLGLYDAKGRLTLAGRVGTGFTEKTLQNLRTRLEGLRTSAPAIVGPAREKEAKGVHWVKPRLVVEVSFAQWTEDGRLRHPSFQGVREDKDAGGVIREKSTRSAKEEGDKEGVTLAVPPRLDDVPPHGRARQSRPRSTVFAGIALTHPDRLVYPESGIKKRDLAEYYEGVANWILPHIADRPLTLVRCPDGWNRECFFQKHPGVWLFCEGLLLNLSHRARRN